MKLLIVILVILVLLIYYSSQEHIISFTQTLIDPEPKAYVILTKYVPDKGFVMGLPYYPEISAYTKKMEVLEICMDKKYRVYSDQVREGTVPEPIWKLLEDIIPKASKYNNKKYGSSEGIQYKIWINGIDIDLGNFTQIPNEIYPLKKLINLFV